MRNIRSIKRASETTYYSLGAPFRPDAIHSSYARRIFMSKPEVRFNLLVRCIGPCGHPQAATYFSLSELSFLKA